MSDNKVHSLVPHEEPVSVEGQLQVFEAGLQGYLSRHGLPAERILADIDERSVTLANLQRVVENIGGEQRARSVYISKFVAAASTGLFDAALNYLWNETILELRNRVIQYDISYFYDNAGLSADKRKKVKIGEDLVDLTDSELIYGAKEIDLVSQVGFRHLDYIRYMRNWVSAAHPNQNEITGLQLITWLETCIKEVITLPLSSATVEIKRLLSSIRSDKIDDDEAKSIAIFFVNLTQEQVNNLASGLFGIYTRTDTTSTARDNVRKLSPLLWGRVDEDTRNKFGIRYGKHVVNNDQEEKALAREFLEHVSALQYIPDDLRAVEIGNAIDQLLTAHRGFDNFNSEPIFARRLAGLVGAHGDLPKQVMKKYVHGLVESFLTNGNGVAWNAEPIYIELLDQLEPAEALIAVLSFRDDTIASRLQFSRCKRKFSELLQLMKPKASIPAMEGLIELIEESSAPLDKLRDDARVAARVDEFAGIIDGLI